ncbi:MAG: DUF547 domain-containing protein [Bacteroidota bacterium]
MKLLSIFAFTLFTMTSAFAQVDHSAWNSILQENVSATGKVNYEAIKKNVSKLDKYLSTLESNTPKSSWSKDAQLAYWINAYNAYTVKLIVDNYPVTKITDLHDGKPWDVKWIKIGGKTYSLNDIEHNTIRKQFDEPRIHFAVNCAAKSCPPLLNQAWTASNLDKLLERQTRTFINNSRYNTISSGKVEVSKIFDWYGEDFGSLVKYLNKYSDTKINSNATVEFRSYDWRLNKA